MGGGQPVAPHYVCCKVGYSARVRCQGARDTLNKPKSQVGFYTFMVKPMYEALDRLLPLGDQLYALQSLTKYWQQQMEGK